MNGDFVTDLLARIDLETARALGVTVVRYLIVIALTLGTIVQVRNRDIPSAALLALAAACYLWVAATLTVTSISAPQVVITLALSAFFIRTSVRSTIGARRHNRRSSDRRQR